MPGKELEVVYSNKKECPIACKPFGIINEPTQPSLIDVTATAVAAGGFCCKFAWTDANGGIYIYEYDGAQTWLIEQPSTPLNEKIPLDVALFTDLTDPVLTQTEFEAWVAANGSVNQTYCVGGTASNPDYYWEYNTTTDNWINTESPGAVSQTKIELTAASFTDLSNPVLTQSEYEAYILANPTKNARFCVGGTSTNPAYVWDVDNVGNSVNVEAPLDCADIAVADETLCYDETLDGYVLICNAAGKLEKLRYNKLRVEFDRIQFAVTNQTWSSPAGAGFVVSAPLFVQTWTNTNACECYVRPFAKGETQFTPTGDYFIDIGMQTAVFGVPGAVGQRWTVGHNSVASAPGNTFPSGSDVNDSGFMDRGWFIVPPGSTITVRLEAFSNHVFGIFNNQLRTLNTSAYMDIICKQ